MQLFERTLSLQLHPLAALQAFVADNTQTYCFFDIETTGLSPKVSSLYLIGALWYDSDSRQICTRQWFADDYISEKEILLSFSDFISGFTTLVHYNGSGFDIPYIEKKCVELEMPSPFEGKKSLDIYKEIRHLKPLFDVPNLKLFTVEKLAGFMRKDVLSGKDCIHIYSQFMQKKYFKDITAMEQERQKLLLHNIEDIIGTFTTAQLLMYTCNGSFTYSEKKDSFVHAFFTISGSFPFAAAREFTDSQNNTLFSVDFADNRIQLNLSLTEGTLCHFFKNYKDYYYLPAEDYAIHKSVGTYVEKEFREPAKASNCYIKKEGTFMSVPSGFTDSYYPQFRTDYKSRQNYILWDEKAKQDSSLMEEILHLLL